jgi:tRNA threonylcarbamoyladenosine biosynthesis protein TsaE
MSHQISHFLADEAATGVFGRQLAACLTPGTVIYLEGDLGAGPVKSPTYTLVEVYVISSLYWYHFDFYRFNHPEEFVDAGLGEYFRSDSVCLVEWPDKAAGFVPPPDLVVALEFQPFEQSGHDGRRVTLSARSPEGEQCLNTFLTIPAANSSALPVVPPSSSS